MPVALITGITGQTGSYLAENLLSKGWLVHGVSREGDRPAPLVTEGVEFHTGDLLDSSRLGTIVREVSPDVVVNLAALSSVAQSWSRPVETARLNGVSVAALIDAALALQRERGRPVGFVQASSAEIFGDAAQSPQDESTPIAPVNPYGASKAYAHLLVGAYRRIGLPASSVILYNHESPRRPETFVTRKITSSVARIRAGVQDRLVLGDLTIKRDWGWAPDYAEAIARIAAAGRPDDYVVATGTSHTIGEFVQAAFAAAGIDDWASYTETDAAFVRPSDATEMRGDASKIADELGWRPSVAFDELVRQMVEADIALLDRSDSA